MISSSVTQVVALWIDESVHESQEFVVSNMSSVIKAKG